MQLLKWCHETGIEASYNLLYGFPQETRDDYAELPEICLRLSHLRPPSSMCQVIFERFSPYHFDADRFKLRLRPWNEYRYIYPESRVIFDRIAYFFQGNWEGQTEDPLDYVAPDARRVGGVARGLEGAADLLLLREGAGLPADWRQPAAAARRSAAASAASI